jgi:hypothetical protein
MRRIRMPGIMEGLVYLAGNLELYVNQGAAIIQ